MNDLLYWIMEYIKVFLGYGFIMFIWPAIVFRKHLKGKGMVYRFGFSATVQIVIINTVVLMLGLFKVLNTVTMWIFFYGILIWSLRDKWIPTEENRKKFKYLVTGTFGWKHLLLQCRNKLVRTAKSCMRTVFKVIKPHWLEYIILGIVIIYGMIYFSYGVFQDYSYGFGDMYVHHSWIYGLTEGQIFSAGVYPEGMHCVIYALHVLFGIDIYSGMLFLAGIHIAVILIAAYLMMRETFHWKYSGIFALVLFLTLDAVCVNQVFSMSRLQWTLPQEYGFHTMYICALFLIRYLKSEKRAVFKGKETKGYWDENLFVFMMALAASIVIHFYSTIMAFLICVGYVLFSLKRIFNKKRFVPLVAAVLCGLLIAVIPMGGALLSGIPFQGSIGWAVNIMNGIDPEAGYTPIAGSDTSDREEVEEQPQAGNEIQGELPGTGVQVESGEQVVMQEEAQPGFFERLLNKLVSIVTGLADTLKEKWDIILKKGFVTLYKKERATWVVGFCCFAFALGVVYRLLLVPLKRLITKEKKEAGFCAGYLSLATMPFIFMIIYTAANLGLPGLVAGARLCSTIQLIVTAVVVIPLDLICTALKKLFPNGLVQFLSLGISVGLVAFVWMTGNYHGYMYFELTRYNAAVTVTNEIMDALPQYSYTIVSPTDELYQVIQDGRHEEITDFLAPDAGKKYTLPTEYVFLFVEKKPIKYAHNHFFSGPDWLALERYQDMYSAYQPSVCPEITCGEISKEAASQPMMYFSKPSQSYSNIDSRIILESKLNEWCEQFAKLYPNELKTYYEDEYFVCYYFQQNPQFLYDLVIE